MATPTTNRRALQGERSREEILDAASLLMSSRGYAGTSISDLAKVSGLPASSIYWHFGSKAGVLGAVMERDSQRYFKDVSAVGPHLAGSPLERLKALMRASVAIVRAHPEFLRLFMLLLLGIDGQGQQIEAVHRVREDGLRHMHLALQRVYRAWGEAVATEIADQLAGLAIAQFDGLFLATQVDVTAVADPMADLMAEAIHTLALHIAEHHDAGGPGARLHIEDGRSS